MRRGKKLANNGAIMYHLEAITYHLGLNYGWASIAACYSETVKVGHLQKMKLHILFLLASTVQSQDTLKGFRFKDNKSKYRWEDGENGIPQFNSDSFLPPSITMCSRGRILYNRHGDYNFWYRVVIKKRKPSTNSVSDEEVIWACTIGLKENGQWWSCDEQRGPGQVRGG